MTNQMLWKSLANINYAVYVEFTLDMIDIDRQIIRSFAQNKDQEINIFFTLKSFPDYEVNFVVLR